MFLTSDTFTDRQQRIRSFDNNDIVISVLLATMDFEWTLRRAIIALGYQKNSTIRDQVLANCSGIDRYKRSLETASETKVQCNAAEYYSRLAISENSSLSFAP